jgi:chromosome segregation ATPase
MTTLIDRANSLIDGDAASTNELEALKVDLISRLREISAAVQEENARIERPVTVEDHEQAEQELKRLRVESGIIHRLIDKLTRAKTRAAAREAIASAKADRKALADAVSEVENLKRQYQSALSQAQGLAEQMRQSLDMVQDPAARNINGGEAVGADHTTAARLAELTLDLTGALAPNRRDAFIRKLVQPGALQKAS